MAKHRVSKTKKNKAARKAEHKHEGLMEHVKKTKKARKSSRRTRRGGRRAKKG